MQRALLALALLFAACGTAPSQRADMMPPSPPSSGNDGGSTPVPEGYAQIRVVHASPGAPAVDVYAHGESTPLVSNLSYANASDYAIVAAGSYTFDVRPTGAAASSTPVYSVGPLDVPASARITAVAAGLLSSTDPSSSFRILPLIEQFDSAAEGTALVRVVHVGADAPAVDLDVGDDGSSEVTGLQRFTDTGASGIALPSGMALQLGIRANGARVTAFTTPAFNDGARLFVFAIGLLADTPREADGFDLLSLDQDGTVRLVRQNPSVYAFHAAPDVRAIDLFSGNTKVVSDIVWGGISAPVQVPPGSYTFDVFAHSTSSDRPSGSPVVSITTPALVPGDRYLATATGFANPARDKPLQIIVQDEEFDSTKTLVRVVHASPDAPAVDVGAANGETIDAVLVSDLSYTQASDAAGIVVTAGTTDVGIAATGTTSAVATFNLVVGSGDRSFVIAAGALDPMEGEQTFELLIVNTATTPWTASAVPQS